MSLTQAATSNHCQVLFCNFCYRHPTQEFFFISDVKVTLRQDLMDVLRVGIRHGE